MTAFMTSVESVVEIILVIALGFYLRKKNKFDEKFKTSISFLIMNIALPASIFVSVLKYLTRDKLVSLSGGLLYALGSFALGYLVAWLLTKILRIRPGRRGTFINMFVNANTIFIGLPLNLALFGEKSMPYFLIYYVMNTVSTWAVGVFFISNDDPTKDKSHKEPFNWRKLLPAPLIGFLVALVFLLLAIPVPAWINSTLSMVGGIVTPMSLIYIGIVLADAGLASIHFDGDTIWALLGRFIIAPALMILMLVIGKSGGAQVPSLESSTLIIQAAAPGLAVLPILAGQSHGDVEYATNVVTTSTVLFVIVVPILMQLVQFI
ncbi:AEC family transporter [Loigolactobacillus coryniformis]|jgi:auxin efflux carrier (AEC)|uniref:L-Malate uniport protein n=3 Tax=Loigolactobacillus coryniformis TaxID=1610 RepID=J3JB31_9LACO|nr:AEC family transporter [Loigolactobacillus coryniformis]OEH90521.1 malate permease [Loigolactobacillus coryniformis subsp. coryniformis]ATO43342.1 malate permease [Loigolactobacillus coryniformis subsp. torquens DSM 20004 = KCTC 3535]ATO55066.1 malate permease [Loigolactobacillus coryniformis subsp. coryniformis KCTC 3167 = DSM 20001]EJN55369.1 L-Malate uniport protein [Loigolactobacillus coryniformis subsp. coryniformis CECT 5711]KRK16451.1 L-malate uniport protein [Loigolactobacillus cory